nr:uncharacterized protein LOC113735331 [Coffea arabica]
MRSRNLESSSLSSSSLNSNTRLCGCELRQKMATYWRDDNPGRRFYGCSRWPRPDRCKYFEWHDEPICTRERIIISGLLRRVNRMEETIAKSRRREKILIVVIILLAMLLIISVTVKRTGHAMERKLVLSLE